MSDTASINAILSQRVTTNKSAEPAPNLKIVEIPESLEKSDRSQTIRGEITRKDKDGTIYIRTDKGEIKATSQLQIPVTKGDQVEIRIDKGNPPQTANLRPSPKQTTANVQPQNVTSVTTNITLPPNLSAQKLISSTPIKVELLTPQLAQTITQPYIENINANLNLVSISSIVDSANTALLTSPQDLLLTPPQDLLLTPPPVLPPNNTTIFPPLQPAELISPNSTQKIQENIVSSFVFRQPTTKIPLNVVVAQIISNPASIPISTVIIPLETPVPAVFSEIKITDIAPPLITFKTVVTEDVVTKETKDLVPPPITLQTVVTEGAKDLVPQQGKQTDQPLITPLPQGQAGETRSELVGFTADKHFPVLLVITPESQRNQHYALQTPVEDIPIGARIEINVTQSTTALPSQNVQITTVAFPALNTTYFLTPEIWPVLQEIQSALTQANPQVAQAFSNIIPNAGAPAQFGATALFFIAALRAGDLQNWIGNKAIDALRLAGKGELVNRLGSEISSLARLNSEPVSQEWRSMSLPLAWQNDIHKIVLHYRGEDENGSDDEQNTGSKTRFIMDLSLSKMGKVQLDGLFVSNPEGVGRLDLILRTEQGFSGAMKADMRRSYKNALDDINFTGELSFQDKKNQWVQITPDTISEFSENI